MKRASTEELLKFKQSLSPLKRIEAKDEVAATVEDLLILSKEPVLNLVEKTKLKRSYQ